MREMGEPKRRWLGDQDSLEEGTSRVTLAVCGRSLETVYFESGGLKLTVPSLV